MNVLLISGLPASGKGTQGKKIASCFRFVHIDAGERLRQEIDLKSETGQEAEKYIIQGKLAPDFLIKKVIKNTLEKYQDPKGFVFDGFPRTKNRLKYWKNLFRNTN